MPDTVQSIFEVRDHDQYGDGTRYSVPETDCEVVIREKWPGTNLEVHRAGILEPDLTKRLQAFVAARNKDAKTLHDAGRELRRMVGVLF